MRSVDITNEPRRRSATSTRARNRPRLSAGGSRGGTYGRPCRSAGSVRGSRPPPPCTIHRLQGRRVGQREVGGRKGGARGCSREPQIVSRVGDRGFTRRRASRRVDRPPRGTATHAEYTGPPSLIAVPPDPPPRGGTHPPTTLRPVSMAKPRGRPERKVRKAVPGGGRERTSTGRPHGGRPSRAVGSEEARCRTTGRPRFEEQGEAPTRPSIAPAPALEAAHHRCRSSPAPSGLGCQRVVFRSATSLRCAETSSRAEATAEHMVTSRSPCRCARAVQERLISRAPVDRAEPERGSRRR